METADNINYPDYVETIYEFKIPSGQLPERLDVFLTNSIRYATRTKVAKAIIEGSVSINGNIAKASKKIQPNDYILCKIYKAPPIELIPENIPLDIVFEDTILLVVNKPPGMVTHPGFGNRYGTLVNAVLYHIGQRGAIAIEQPDDEEEYGDDINEGKIFSGDEIRPGIVHRLDKETSGLLLVVKDSSYHPFLAKQFEDRTIERFYYALVWGDIKDDSGTYTGDIGRNPKNRKLFAVVKKDGKPAQTDFWVLKRFGFATLVKIKLRTGRTHQIRVHFAHNRHPVLGDCDYGGDSLVSGGGIPEYKKTAEKCLKIAKRQMLHAKVLGFTHPVTQERLSFEADLPYDFLQVLEILNDSKV